MFKLNKMDQSIEIRLNSVLNQLKADIVVLKNKEELALVEVKFLGRQGEVNKLFRELPIKDNPQVGKAINELKNQVELEIANKLNDLISKIAHFVN